MKLSKKQFVLVIPFIITSLIGIGFALRLLFFTDPIWRDYVIAYIGESKLFWSGVDPISQTGSGAFPWAYVLDVFFVAHFLKSPYYYIYGSIVMILVFVAMVRIIRKLLMKRLGFSSQKAMMWAFLMCLAMYPYSLTVGYGNIGAICCAFAVMSLYLKDKNTVLAGICLAIALIKPHATGMFLLLFVLMGNWFSATVAVLLVGASTAFAGWYLHTSIIDLLVHLLDNGSNGNMAYGSMGIASILSLVISNVSRVFMISFVMSIIYFGALYFYLRKNCVKDTWVLACVCSICVSTWYYENMQDEYVLIIPMFLLFQMCYEKYSEARGNIVELIMIAVMSMGGIGCAFMLKKPFELLLGFRNGEVVWILDTVFHLFIMCIGVCVCRYYVKKSDGRLCGN